MLIVSCDLSKWPVIKPVTELELSASDWKLKAHELTVFALKRILSMPAALVYPPYWIFARLALSVLTGLVVGLYFVGTFPSSPDGVARIFAMCVFIGYAAPTIWLAKEKWVLTIVQSDVFKDQLAKIIKQVVFDAKMKEEENEKTP